MFIDFTVFNIKNKATSCFLPFKKIQSNFLDIRDQI